MGTEPIKLNLGCGRRIWDGFINIDFPGGNYSGQKPDLEVDIRKLPFEDNYADQIYAIHIIEHFYRWEIVDILKEWMRVLKPGGIIVLEAPCLDKIIAIMANSMQDGFINTRLTLWGLFGDPNYKDPYMTHHWCFSIDEIKKLLQEAGFKDSKYEEPQFHHKQRDMRIYGTKP